MRNESYFYSLASSAHFYFSLTMGWRFFDVVISPDFFEGPIRMSALQMTFPIYALYVLAFGSLVYVSTRPFYLLFEQSVRLFIEGVTRILEKSRREQE